MNVLAGLYLPDRRRGRHRRRPASARLAESLGRCRHRHGPPAVQAGRDPHGLENLSLAQDRGRLLQPSKAGAAVRALMADLGFEIDLSAQVWQMPLAVRQQLEILRTLAIGAKVLILDEPTSVLSPLETVRLFRIIRRIADSGRAVVLISHKLGEVLEVADDLVVMRGGRVVHRGAGRRGRCRPPRPADRRRSRPRPGRPAARAFRRAGAAGRGSRGRRATSALPRSAARASRSAPASWWRSSGVAGNGQTELLQAIGGVRPYRGRIAPAARRRARLRLHPGAASGRRPGARHVDPGQRRARPAAPAAVRLVAAPAERAAAGPRGRRPLRRRSRSRIAGALALGRQPAAPRARPRAAWRAGA